MLLTPFILIGLALVIGFLSSLGGRTEITMEGGKAVLFTGIGPVGFRRRFQTGQVRAVRIETRRRPSRRGGHRDSRDILIELHEGKPLMFGSGLREERLQFVAAALRGELSV